MSRGRGLNKFRLVVGGKCRNGHVLTSAYDIVLQKNGGHTCRICRQLSDRAKHMIGRPNIQGVVCDLCNGSFGRIEADHDHESWLCRGCNFLVGIVETKNIDLEQLRLYIDRNDKKRKEIIAARQALDEALGD